MRLLELCKNSGIALEREARSSKVNPKWPPKAAKETARHPKQRHRNPRSTQKSPKKMPRTAQIATTGIRKAEVPKPHRKQQFRHHNVNKHTVK